MIPGFVTEAFHRKYGSAVDYSGRKRVLKIDFVLEIKGNELQAAAGKATADAMAATGIINSSPNQSTLNNNERDVRNNLNLGSKCP